MYMYKFMYFTVRHKSWNLKRPESLDELIDELFRLDFQKSEILKMMPKLAGVLAELNVPRITEIHDILTKRLEVPSKIGLKQIYLESPTLLSHGTWTLESRLGTGKNVQISCLIKLEKISDTDCLLDEHKFCTDDIRRNPSVLELTPAIIRYRYGNGV